MRRSWLYNRKISGFGPGIDWALFQSTNKVLICGIRGSHSLGQLMNGITSERFNLSSRILGDRLGVEVEVDADAEIIPY